MRDTVSRVRTNRHDKAECLLMAEYRGCLQSKDAPADNESSPFETLEHLAPLVVDYLEEDVVVGELFHNTVDACTVQEHTSLPTRLGCDIRDRQSSQKGWDRTSIPKHIDESTGSSCRRSKWWRTPACRTEAKANNLHLFFDRLQVSVRECDEVCSSKDNMTHVVQVGQ